MCLKQIQEDKRAEAEKNTQLGKGSHKECGLLQSGNIPSKIKRTWFLG